MPPVPCMPELPDIETSLSALRCRVLGQQIEACILKSPFLHRTVDPPVSGIVGREVLSLRRIGKRIVLGLTHELFMIYSRRTGPAPSTSGSHGWDRPWRSA